MNFGVDLSFGFLFLGLFWTQNFLVGGGMLPAPVVPLGMVMVVDPELGMGEAEEPFWIEDGKLDL